MIQSDDAPAENKLSLVCCTEIKFKHQHWDTTSKKTKNVRITILKNNSNHKRPNCNTNITIHKHTCTHTHTPWQVTEIIQEQVGEDIELSTLVGFKQRGLESGWLNVGREFQMWRSRIRKWGYPLINYWRIGMYTGVEVSVWHEMCSRCWSLTVFLKTIFIMLGWF